MTQTRRSSPRAARRRQGTRSVQLPCRAVWLHLAGRSRRRRDQDQVAAGRHAAPVSVEPARRGRFFLGTNRGKRALALDLKQKEGLAVLHRMVESADVLVENFRPSVPARLGIDYPRLRAINPRLIYAGLTGYGDSGSAQRKGRFRSGPAMPYRDGGIPGRRRRRNRSSCSARCSTISRRRCLPTASPRRCFSARRAARGNI